MAYDGIRVVSFGTVVRKRAVCSRRQRSARCDRIKRGIDAVVVTNIELVLLADVEVITHQEDLGIVSLSIRAFFVEREIKRLVNTAGDRATQNACLAQIVHEDGAGLKQLLLFVGNEEERFVFASVMTLTALTETRNRKRSSD